MYQSTIYANYICGVCAISASGSVRWTSSLSSSSSLWQSVALFSTKSPSRVKRGEFRTQSVWHNCWWSLLWRKLIVYSSSSSPLCVRVCVYLYRRMSLATYVNSKALIKTISPVGELWVVWVFEPKIKTATIPEIYVGLVCLLLDVLIERVRVNIYFVCVFRQVFFFCWHTEHFWPMNYIYTVSH